MADLQELVCMTDECIEDAVMYCCSCKQLFCEAHTKVHSDFVKILRSKSHAVITVEDYQAEREEDSQHCSRHDKSAVVLACEECYLPMCPKCLDNTNKLTCEGGENDKHSARSLDQVAGKIHDEFSEFLSELRVNEMMNDDDLKERRKQFDEQMEEDRKSLDRLDSKVQELHKIIDDFGVDTRENLVKNMNERKNRMAEWETQFSTYQSNCQKARDKITRFLERHHAGIVRNHKAMKGDLALLKTFKLTTDRQMRLCIQFKDKPLNIPIQLKESYRLPKRLDFKETRPTPGGKTVYTVQYLQDGLLLHSGDYPITGLGFTPKDANDTKCSLFEHGSSLYVVADQNWNLRVHIVDLKIQTTRESVLNLSSEWYNHQIAVNDQYIAISDDPSKSVKIYSTSDKSHALDIQHTCINARPWGVAFINNTIVVGDHNKNQVSNLTISANPIVKWTCTEIDQPTAIRVCDESRVIMVASYSNKIHFLSHKGEKLSTLDVPECSCIFDFALRGKELAIADNASSKIHLYEMKAE